MRVAPESRNRAQTMDQEPGMYFGIVPRQIIAPGRSLEVEVPLADCVRVLEPGVVAIECEFLTSPLLAPDTLRTRLSIRFARRQFFWERWQTTHHLNALIWSDDAAKRMLAIRSANVLEPRDAARGLPMRTLPDRYATVGRRDFRAALEYLLETEFKLVGSHRVIRLIAEAVVELQRQFYPEYKQLEPGTILWATTKAGEQAKVSWGKPSESYGIQMVRLPLVTKLEIETRMQPGPGHDPLASFFACRGR